MDHSGELPQAKGQPDLRVYMAGHPPLTEHSTDGGYSMEVIYSNSDQNYDSG